jgi:hypothetical protein
MRRYRQFIQTLNNIQKVCILLNTVMNGLDPGWAGEVLAAGGVVRSLGSVAAPRYAEAFTVHEAELDSDSDYSVN